MAPDGGTYEALVLVEVDADHVAAIYLLPLAELTATTDYTLVGVARHTATRRFAEGRKRLIRTRHPYHDGRWHVAPGLRHSKRAIWF